MPKHHRSQKLAAVSAQTTPRPGIINGQHPTPVLATAAIKERLADLKQAVKCPEYAALRPVERDLSALSRTVHRTVSDGVYQIAKTEDGLRGLYELLKKAHGTCIPAHHLTLLLSPLLRQLHRAGNDIGQLL